MSKTKIIVTLAVIIALEPLLGFPHRWESFFQIFAGISIVLISVWSIIDKKISLRVKAQKRQIHKLREVELGREEETQPRAQDQGVPNEQVSSEEDKA